MDVTFTGTERKSVLIILGAGEKLGDVEGPLEFYAKVDGASPIWVELLRQRVKVKDPMLVAQGQDGEVDIAASLDDRTHTGLGASDAPPPSIYPSEVPTEPQPLSAYPDVVAARARHDATDPKIQKAHARAQDKATTAPDQDAAVHGETKREQHEREQHEKRAYRDREKQEQREREQQEVERRERERAEPAKRGNDKPKAKHR